MMKTKLRCKSTAARRGALLSMPLLAAVATPGFALDVYLKTGTTTFTPPGGGAAITMWGYQSCDSSFTTCGAVSVPGPAINVPTADSLTVHLSNTLPEPTSLVIDGLKLPMDGTSVVPVKVADANGTMRVRSLVHEAAAGGTADYVFPEVKPGTFLYRSATHMQVQDQMGLYGTVTKNAVDPIPGTAGQVYGAGSSFDKEVVMLYSEIDPVIHHAVANGQFGNNPPTGSCNAPVSAPNNLPAGWVCSTVNYDPKYFLINGHAYSGSGSNEFAASAAGQKTLLRFLNAGLQTHVPMLTGLDMTLVAEDGNVYPYVKTQYSAFLPAMKTMDAIIQPSSSGKLSIIDRMLNLTNNGAAPGGMLAFLNVGAAVTPQFATTGCLAGVQAASVNSAFSCQVTGLPSANDTAVSYSLISGPAALTMDANGLISWPSASPVGSNNAVTVQIADAGNAANAATTSFNIVVKATAPQAVIDPVIGSVFQGKVLTVAAPGVLENDQSNVLPPNDGLTAQLVSDVSHGTLALNANGGFSYTPAAGFSGDDSFSYKAIDSTGSASNTVTATITVIANTAPTAVADGSYNVNAGSSFVLAASGVLANDSDPDNVAQGQALTAIKVTNPAHGAVTMAANGGFTYIPVASYLGADSFTYKVSDGIAYSADTTVSFNVMNSAPVAVDDVAAVNKNRSLTISVLANDTDAENNINPAAVTPGILPGHGRVKVNANGTITYTPAKNYVGTDSFTYTVADKTAAVSNAATVSVCVGACPVADVYAAAAGLAAFDVTAIDGVLVNDVPLTGTRTATLVAGSLTKNGLAVPAGTGLRCQAPNAGNSLNTTKICSNGAFRLNLPTLEAERAGSYSFQYTMKAGGATSAPVTVTVTVP